MQSIEFVNHASVILSNGNTSMLTDPWYEGDVFNKGWQLLHEFNDDEIVSIINRVNYIWISHEHPDHFSIIFFKKYSSLLIKKGIKIIFQNTFDKRVITFLKSLKLDVIELRDNTEMKLDENFIIKIIKVDFYDSALIAQIDKTKIINLNDCPISSKRDLIKFKKRSGEADILLSQFSYAAWKGGKNNIEWRKAAAKEKLLIIQNQADILKCKKIIPFASYIYFSNKENEYLNDSVNNSRKVLEFFKNKSNEIYFMRPFEKQILTNLIQSKTSLDFWDQKFHKISEYKQTNYEKSFTLSELNQEHLKYKNRIFKKNNYLIIKLLSFLKFLNIFSDIDIRLYDLDLTINYSLFGEIETVHNSKNNEVVIMHSNSLMFILKNEFGFDTLTVNANFQANKDGFSRMVKSFAIGSLNAMGLSLSFSAFFKPSVFLLLLNKLTKVKNNLE